MLDRIETHPSDVKIKGSKPWAQEILNGIFEKGNENEKFDFVSTTNLTQVLVPFQNFYQNKYFHGEEINNGKISITQIISYQNIFK